jgi:hypothetical protein
VFIAYRSDKKMESVWLRATRSFVNRISGSVTKKQKICVPKVYAESLVEAGFAVYLDEPVNSQPAKKPMRPKRAPKVAGGGKKKQSASSPAETASTKNKSVKQSGDKTQTDGS